MWEKPSSVTVASDSQATIAAMDASARIFTPYFQNRLSEMHRNFEEMGQMLEVRPMWRIPGPLNPADLPCNTLLQLAQLVLERTNSFPKALSVMSRLTKALVCYDRQKIQEPLSPGDIAVGNKLLFASRMEPTQAAWE